MKNSFPEDRYWMKEALKCALLGEGLTNPNPAVGAVLVKNGELIGKGYHSRAGAAHAEIEAIEDAKKRGISVCGSTLYVTLEPCNSWGKTPPCTQYIIREKIGRVVAGSPDPNPKNNPRAVEVLPSMGISFSWELLDEALFLNRGFYHRVLTGKPWVIAKIAMAIDGSLSAGVGDERWISGLPARTLAHKLRMVADGILIGAQTARVDNPQLTIRLVDKRYKVQPWRVILSLSGKLPRDLTLFRDAFKERTLVCVRMPIEMVLKELGSREVSILLVEGGAAVLHEMLKEGCVHEISFFLSAVIIGKQPLNVNPYSPANLSFPFALVKPSWEKLGEDIYCHGLLEKGSKFLESIRIEYASKG
ncbi:bifunctional diaminohydroxyphosphoribosylaminopyrimidine deaminase/5-amino-6-(5-phosphoribosylamino)uracil reductase RibD [Methylacidiphilum caldifontis]|uniref:Riboflavin biosynthesis protein RibD n=1 Tax=Methylacidiphilum caldifontis TaxID=2795386 RepID=A0A4Y8PGZ3_9BACT|nr:bifunctional diaminohydroxyphosphoribosylaminopyrimidine deaminase/5-amino-6-(5-phosphoribosylamino)uracil reductase RibD [Methylacidiphilum caldifontis]TFE71341.1 riboflavin biosynthesis protein RibD [Methylacidiphilum caldifontis]